MTHQGSETFLRNLQSRPLKVKVKEIVIKRLNIEKSNKKIFMDSILRRIDEVIKNCMKSIHRWVDVVQN